MLDFSHLAPVVLTIYSLSNSRASSIMRVNNRLRICCCCCCCHYRIQPKVGVSVNWWNCKKKSKEAKRDVKMSNHSCEKKWREREGERVQNRKTPIAKRYIMVGQLASVLTQFVIHSPRT